MIRTGASRGNIPSPFAPLIHDVIDEFDRAHPSFGELHLYGSVATGTARAGESDVDLLLINGAPEWAHVIGERLSRRYAYLCRGVEIGVAHESDYASVGDEAYGNRVFLRHYCVSLAGVSAIRQPAPFAGDARAARGFNGDIAARLTQWRTGGADARRVARKALVSAAGVISICEGTWTTDRDIAARSWAQLDCPHTDEVGQLLAWADGTLVASPDQLAAALAPDGIVAFIADQLASVVGLWTDAGSTVRTWRASVHVPAYRPADTLIAGLQVQRTGRAGASDDLSVDDLVDAQPLRMQVGHHPVELGGVDERLDGLGGQRQGVPPHVDGGFGVQRGS